MSKCVENSINEYFVSNCVFNFVSFSLRRRAAAAARAMAALTSSSMSGVFPPIAAAMPLMPPMGSVPAIIPAKGSFFSFKSNQILTAIAFFNLF